MSGSDIIFEIASRPVPSLPQVDAIGMTPADILRARKTPKRDDDPMTIARNVGNLVDSHDLLTQSVANVAGDLDDYAPETAQDLRTAMSRALFFLASKAPKESPSAPGMPALPPPRQDVLRFQRYVRAIDDPMSILDDAEAGTLSPEAVEAVRAVYPNIYETMQADIASMVGNAPNLPYSRRMQISALLGQDMTGTLRPAVAMSAQNAYATTAQQDKPQQIPLTRAQSLGVANRAEYGTVARREAQRGVGSWNRSNR